MMVMTVWSVVVPNSALRTETVAGPVPTSAPDGTVVDQTARPFADVRPSAVTVGMPGMLRVNVTSAPPSGRPSGSVTIAVSRRRDGSEPRRNR